MIHAFFIIVALYVGLYGTCWLFKLISDKRWYSWIALPLIIVLPFVGGVLGMAASCAILVIFLAWVLGAKYRTNQPNQADGYNRYNYLPKEILRRGLFESKDAYTQRLQMAHQEEILKLNADWQAIQKPKKGNYA